MSETTPPPPPSTPHDPVTRLDPVIQQEWSGSPEPAAGPSRSRAPKARVAAAALAVGTMGGFLGYFVGTGASTPATSDQQPATDRQQPAADGSFGQGSSGQSGSVGQGSSGQSGQAGGSSDQQRGFGNGGAVPGPSGSTGSGSTGSGSTGSGSTGSGSTGPSTSSRGS